MQPLTCCRAEPVDIEDATSMPALSTAAMAATATTAVASTLSLPQEDALQDPVLGSGPGLSDAIVTATATPAHMVAVPLSEQHPVTMPGPGFNAAFLEQQADPILVTTATTIDEAVAAGSTADATVAERQSPLVTAVTMAESSTATAAASTAESVVMQSTSGVSSASTTAVAAAEATTFTTAVAQDQHVAVSDHECASTVAETQRASKVERLSAAAVTTMHMEASGSSMLASAVDTVAMTSLASTQQHVYTSTDQSKADAVVECTAESNLLVSHLSFEHIKAHRSSQGPDVASDDDPTEALDSTQADMQEQNSMSEPRLQADLSTTISGVPLLAQRPGSKLERMHSALRTRS